MIYLDHAATTPTDEAVIRAMEQCMRDTWQNPSAAYHSAGAARREMRLARQALAGMLNARTGELLFTSGGTEGNNQALSLAHNGHAVVSAIEHSSVLNAAAALCQEVTLVPPDEDGCVSPRAVEQALRPDTRLISVMLANNETGILQPVSAIGELARARHIPLHCDAVQAFGHIPVDVRNLKVDLLTLSGHKLYGPRGIGVLFVREGIPLSPLIHGGGQEFALRSGTENLPAICGLRAAAELARADMDDRAARERRLLCIFLKDLMQHVPSCRLLGERAPRLPGIVALLLPGLASESAIAKLDLMGIQLSGGAACASRERGVSHVYRAMHLSESDAACILRVSIGRATTSAELKTAAQAIGQVWESAHL